MHHRLLILSLTTLVSLVACGRGNLDNRSAAKSSAFSSPMDRSCKSLVGTYSGVNGADQTLTFTLTENDKAQLVMSTAEDDLILDGKTYTLASGAVASGTCKQGLIQVHTTPVEEDESVMTFTPNEEGLLVQTNDLTPMQFKR